uniref:Uncharacterized protein n=1 Tax=Arundo donax TaxID=35708 RepID=A0A0A9HMY5_ARUDO
MMPSLRSTFVELAASVERLLNVCIMCQLQTIHFFAM